jgi:hypothetical protein
VLRRACFDRAGLFNPQLKIAEDCDLWFRVAVTSRLESGDLSRPVSAYWRHGSSAYQANPKLRLNMIRVMTGFERWLRQTCPQDPRRAAIARRIAGYILDGIADARTRGERDWAWSLGWQAAGLYPPLACYKQWYGHMVRMAVGR